jgi:hypothetical protein
MNYDELFPDNKQILNLFATRRCQLVLVQICKKTKGMHGVNKNQYQV